MERLTTRGSRAVPLSLSARPPARPPRVSIAVQSRLRGVICILLLLGGATTSGVARSEDQFVATPPVAAPESPLDLLSFYKPSYFISGFTKQKLSPDILAEYFHDASTTTEITLSETLGVCSKEDLSSFFDQARKALKTHQDVLKFEPDALPPPLPLRPQP